MTPSATLPLIPRAKLFGNPTRAQAQISPDGRWLSWLAPKDGVLNIWLAPVADIGAARVITNDKKRGIRFYGWAYDSTHVLYMQDEGGTEDFHIYAVTIATGETRDLTPIAGVQARIHDMSLDEPDVVAIEINDRDKSWHDLYRIDIRTGERELLFENRQELSRIVLDANCARGSPPRPARRKAAASATASTAASSSRSASIEHEDDLTTYTIGFTRDGKTLYGISSVGRDTAALLATRLGDGQGARAGRAPEGGHRPHHRPSPDVRHRGRRRPAPDAGLDPARGAHGRRPEAAARPAPRRGQHRRPDARRQPLDRGGERGGGAGHLSPLRARHAASIAELFATRPDLAPYRLAPMRGNIVRARDGLELVCYLTLPAGREAGSPRRRCRWCSACTADRGPATAGASTRNHQWLANRGYAVLSVNYRGSTGFGKKFINAGERRVGRQDARRPARRRRLGGRSRASPTEAGSPSWAAATAATRRWSA